jgi:hypothetical protein
MVETWESDWAFCCLVDRLSSCLCLAKSDVLRCVANLLQPGTSIKKRGKRWTGTLDYHLTATIRAALEQSVCRHLFSILGLFSRVDQRDEAIKLVASFVHVTLQHTRQEEWYGCLQVLRLPSRTAGICNCSTAAFCIF